MPPEKSPPIQKRKKFSIAILFRIIRNVLPWIAIPIGALGFVALPAFLDEHKDVTSSVFGALRHNTGSILTVFGGIVSLVALEAAATSMAKFLRTPTRSFTIEDTAERYRRIEEDIIDKYRNQALPNLDKEELVKTLQAEIEKIATERFLDKIKTSLDRVHATKEWESHFQGTLRRVEDEVSRQAKRGELNLILGVLTAASGIVFLVVMFLFVKPYDAASTSTFIMALLPRVSIVSLIEVFAYFFLRLYKASLAEIKYFQNEATSLEMRFVGVRVALQTDNSELLAEVTRSLLAVERNPILEKNRSTLELERERLDQRVVALSVPGTLSLIRDLVSAGEKATEANKQKS